MKAAALILLVFASVFSAPSRQAVQIRTRGLKSSKKIEEIKSAKKLSHLCFDRGPRVLLVYGFDALSRYD